MKRKAPEAVAADEAAMRVEFVRELTGALRKRNVRQRLHVLPAELFARVVDENKEHMMWATPERVFEQAPNSRVALNSAEVEAWLATKSELVPRRPGGVAKPSRISYAELYRVLFVDPVAFVPWPTFLEHFKTAALDTVRAVAAARVLDPKRITLLVLRQDATSKSNAWLTGLAWRLLARVVDFVVFDAAGVLNVIEQLESLRAVGTAAHEVFGRVGRATLPPAASAGGGEDEAEGERSADDREHERQRAAFVAAFKIDLIYVDDMLYSGEQAGDAIFKGGSATAAYNDRVSVRILAPYVATPAYERMQLYNSAVCPVFLPERVERVRGYRERMAPAIERLQRRYALSDELLDVLAAEQPAIVFEHKLADGLSLPKFFFGWALRDVPELADMPPLVRNAAPFYKTSAFPWRNRRSRDKVLLSFADVRTLFAAAQLNWAARPPCVQCGASAEPLHCGGCAVLPFCSAACHGAYRATPAGRNHARACRALGALAGAGAGAGTGVQ